MVASVNSRGLDMLLEMAKAPRRRYPTLAAAAAVLATVLIVASMVVVAGDGVPHDEDEALWQAPWLEAALLAGLLFLPVATLCLLGVRPRQASGYLFARVPGARLWLAYLISLFFTGMPIVLVAGVLGVVFSTPSNLSDVDGAQEAFGWLFLRAIFVMVGGLLLCGVGLTAAVIARAVVTTIHGRRALATKEEAAGANFLVGILILVLLVFALPISMALAGNSTRRLVFGATFAGLIVLSTLVLFLIARRADRTAEATGGPNWTRGMVETRMRPEAYAAVGGLLMVSLGWLVIRASGRGVQAEVLFACDLTGCSTLGLTFAGWLIVALPAVLIIATAVLWHRLGSPVRVALILAALVLCGNGALFVPGLEETFSDVGTGPGSRQVIGGLGWAGAGVAAVVVWCLLTMMLGTKFPWLKRKLTIVVSSLALLLVALAVAIARAEPAMLRAEELFPATLKMNGDTLVRTMARDQRGCDGILPDDTQMNAQECLFTVHAAYITDDSDAVVTIHATRYHDIAAARTVHAGLRADVRPTGMSGEVLTDSFQSFRWVAIVTSGHSDGRPITPDEQSWVRWPLRQLTVHFIRNDIGGSGGGPKPNPSASPRTPGQLKG